MPIRRSPRWAAALAACAAVGLMQGGCAGYAVGVQGVAVRQPATADAEPRDEHGEPLVQPSTPGRVRMPAGEPGAAAARPRPAGAVPIDAGPAAAGAGGVPPAAEVPRPPVMSGADDGPAPTEAQQARHRQCVARMYAERAQRGRGAPDWALYDQCMKTPQGESR